MRRWRRPRLNTSRAALRLHAPLLAAVLASAGCLSASPSPPSASPSPVPTSTPLQEPVVPGGRPQIFSFAVGGEPTLFSPAATDAPSRRVNALLYSALYRLDGALRPVPDLAAGLPVVAPDGVTWSVSLRAGLRFHDGSPLTAADVVFTYRLALSANCPFGEGICGAVAERLAAVDPAGAESAVFRLRARSAPFLSLGLAALPILPEKAVRASSARLEATVRRVDRTKVTQLTERIAAATNAERCIAETPPHECDIASYAAELEATLRTAGIALPEQARFRQPGGEADRQLYASTLLAMVEGLASSLQTRDIDALAAAFPLLDFQRRPVGSGPYALVEYRPAQTVELVRKAPANGTGVPGRARAVILVDPSAAATALRTGDVDWLPEVSADEVPTLEDERNVRVAGRPGSIYRAIVFNVRPGRVYAELAARQAFAGCLEREATIRQATSGRAALAWSPTSPASWAHRRSPIFPRPDPAAAQALLRAAGWRRGPDGIQVKNGVRLSSRIYVRSSRGDQLAFAQSASEQLRRCGIELRVEELGFSGDALLRQIGYPNDFDTYLAENRLGLDPHEDFAIFHTRRITTRANPGDSNFGGWSNRQADLLIDGAAAELNPVRRVQLYHQLQDILARELPLYPLWYETSYAGLSPRVIRPEGEIDLRSPFYDWDVDRWRLRGR